MSNKLKVAISTACCGGSWVVLDWVRGWIAKELAREQKRYPFELGLELQPRRDHTLQNVWTLASPVFSLHAPFWNSLCLSSPKSLVENLLWWPLQGGPGENRILNFSGIVENVVIHDNTVRMLLDTEYIKPGDPYGIAVENNLAVIEDTIHTAKRLKERIERVSICLDLAHEARTEVISPARCSNYTAGYVQGRLIPNLHAIRSAGFGCPIVHLHNLDFRGEKLVDHRHLAEGILPMEEVINELCNPRWGVEQFTLEVATPLNYLAQLLGQGYVSVARRIKKDLDLIAGAVG